MKPALYVETSIVSYYTGRPSRDLIVAGRQQVTRDWWDAERQKYAMYVSALVIQECERGEPTAATLRRQALKGIPLLGTCAAAEELAQAVVSEGPIPPRFPEDALHIALASVAGMDYLLTWNFRHINNATMKSDVAKIVTLLGHDCPVICTPEELMEANDEDA